MIVATIKVTSTVKVLAPNVQALDAYREKVATRVAHALPQPSRTRTDKDTGVRVLATDLGVVVPISVAREGGEA